MTTSVREPGRIYQAFVTSLSPLKVKLTGTSAELPVTQLAGLNQPLAVADRVLVAVADYDVIIVNFIGPPAPFGGTYTPTLTALATGTGGSPQNTATYLFVGGPAVGDMGLLFIKGLIAFGTTGPTYPSNTSRVHLPAGFNNSVSPVSTYEEGHVRYNVVGVGYSGAVATDISNADRLQFFALQTPTVVEPMWIQNVPLSSTTPGPWQAADQIRWFARLMAVRV